MKPSAQNLYANAKQSHEIIYQLMSQLRQEIDRCNNMHELCDYIYAVNESHEYAEDIKRELWKLKEYTAKKICEMWIVEVLQHRMAERSLKTDYVTATPKIDQSPNIPSQTDDPAGYKALLDYFGIDSSNWADRTNESGEFIKKSEVVKFHWPGLVDYVTKELASGKPAPPGIDISKLVPVYKVSLRKRRNVLDAIDVDVDDVDAVNEENKK